MCLVHHQNSIVFNNPSTVFFNTFFTQNKGLITASPLYNQTSYSPYTMGHNKYSIPKGMSRGIPRKYRINTISKLTGKNTKLYSTRSTPAVYGNITWAPTTLGSPASPVLPPCWLSPLLFRLCAHRFRSGTSCCPGVSNILGSPCPLGFYLQS